MKLINNFIKGIMLFGCVTMINFGCKGATKVNETTDKEVRAYIDLFYSFIDKNPKKDNVKDWFLNRSIEFYIQDNTSSGNELQIITDNSENTFISIISEFRIETGIIKNKEVTKITFEKQPYDVAESDLYIIQIEVNYLKITTHETFFIKKTNEGYKIFRYFINYNSGSLLQCSNK